MSNSGHEPATPSAADGDGVRVVRGRRSRLSAATVVTVLAGVAVVAGIATLFLSAQTLQTQRTAAARTGNAGAAAVSTTSVQAPIAAPPRVSATAVRTPARHTAAPAMSIPHEPGPGEPPSGDPNDLASYLSPTDPPPTMAEVIQALHDSGDRTGLGAFNPPGTSPLLVGLAVPEDFDLPPGYVRHHQVTDEGEVLEPILMFSPEGTFVDASGRPIAIPDDRVVPADMAPPGLAIREITIPPPPAAQRPR